MEGMNPLPKEEISADDKSISRMKAPNNDVALTQEVARADFLFDAESSFPAMIWGGEQIDGIFEFIAWRGDPNRGGAG